jgi:ubiquinone/menaquinone biosynthesis C-methylase UbiE
MTPRFIARQLSRPSGLAGRIIAGLMNRRNAAMNMFAIGRLQIEPSDRVIEIGFGGGVALPHLIEKARFVTGVDRSPDVVRQAKKRFGQHVEAGSAAFHEGNVEELPFNASSFEKALTVNTVYFWRSLQEGFREIYRVLAPGGQLSVGLLPKEHMDLMNLPKDIFTSRTITAVISAIEETGFSVRRIEKPEPTTSWVVIIASR